MEKIMKITEHKNKNGENYYQFDGRNLYSFYPNFTDKSGDLEIWGIDQDGDQLDPSDEDINALKDFLGTASKFVNILVNG